MRASSLLPSGLSSAGISLSLFFLATTFNQHVYATPVPTEDTNASTTNASTTGAVIEGAEEGLPAGLLGLGTVVGSSKPTLPSDFPSVEDAQGWLKFTPATDACVFYTSKLKDVAQTYAKGSKTTIWDVYPEEKYDLTLEPQKSWSDDVRRVYFQRTSRAFARSCSGKAYVVIPHGKDACHDSIWITDEYAAISKGETGIDVNSITRIDEDGNEDGAYTAPSSSTNDESCAPEPRFKGNDPANYWGN